MALFMYDCEGPRDVCGGMDEKGPADLGRKVLDSTLWAIEQMNIFISADVRHPEPNNFSVNFRSQRYHGPCCELEESLILKCHHLNQLFSLILVGSLVVDLGHKLGLVGQFKHTGFTSSAKFVTQGNPAPVMVKQHSCHTHDRLA